MNSQYPFQCLDSIFTVLSLNAIEKVVLILLLENVAVVCKIDTKHGNVSKRLDCAYRSTASYINSAQIVEETMLSPNPSSCKK